MIPVKSRHKIGGLGHKIERAETSNKFIFESDPKKWLSKSVITRKAKPKF